MNFYKVKNKLYKISWNFYKKSVYQNVIRYPYEKKILIVIGCQRSGTKLMLDIFHNDLKTSIFREFSRLSSLDPDKIRLNPLDMVVNEINKEKSSFIVLKPLVESQYIDRILNNLKNSKAIWVYRNYKDVASSHITKFSVNNGINNLRPIIDKKKDNWRSENVSEHVKKIVNQYFSENMDQNDAAVLFWYVRNSLFFDLEMDQNNKIMMLKYDDLILFPEKVIPCIYDEMSQSFPGRKIYSHIHSDSLGKGNDLKVSPEIMKLADDMMSRLDASYMLKKRIFNWNF